jgi:antitoxin (DNA-binding transcriptional repressor) of toxin-antitoxin stability system
MLQSPGQAVGRHALDLLCDVVPCRLKRASLLFDRVCRQLQHCSPLSRDKIGDQNDCAVGKFQRIVMMSWFAKVYLTKSGHPIANVLPAQKPVGLHIILEGNLGSGTKADGDLQIVRTGKSSSCRGAESGGNQRFGDLGGTTGNRV